jgi:hypothetical protein
MIEKEEACDSDRRKSDFFEEKKRWCCSCTKKEIISLRSDVKVIFSLRARSMCIAWDSAQFHVSERTFGVGTHGQLRKKPHHVLDSTYRTGVGLEQSFIPIRVDYYCCTDSSGC